MPHAELLIYRGESKVRPVENVLLGEDIQKYLAETQRENMHPLEFHPCGQDFYFSPFLPTEKEASIFIEKIISEIPNSRGFFRVSSSKISFGLYSFFRGLTFEGYDSQRKAELMRKLEEVLKKKDVNLTTRRILDRQKDLKSSPDELHKTLLEEAITQSGNLWEKALEFYD